MTTESCVGWLATEPVLLATVIVAVLVPTGVVGLLVLPPEPEEPPVDPDIEPPPPQAVSPRVPSAITSRISTGQTLGNARLRRVIKRYPISPPGIQKSAAGRTGELFAGLHGFCTSDVAETLVLMVNVAVSG